MTDCKSKIAVLGGVSFFVGYTKDGDLVAVAMSEVTEIDVPCKIFHMRNGGEIQFRDSILPFFYSEASDAKIKQPLHPDECLLAELPLSARALNCFRAIGIFRVGQIANMSEAEFLRLPNLGRRTLREIMDVVFGG